MYNPNIFYLHSDFAKWHPTRFNEETPNYTSSGCLDHHLSCCRLSFRCPTQCIIGKPEIRTKYSVSEPGLEVTTKRVGYRISIYIHPHRLLIFFSLFYLFHQLTNAKRNQHVAEAVVAWYHPVRLHLASHPWWFKVLYHTVIQYIYIYILHVYVYNMPGKMASCVKTNCCGYSEEMLFVFSSSYEQWRFRQSVILLILLLNLSLTRYIFIYTKSSLIVKL